MAEYLVSVVVMSAILGIISYLSYGDSGGSAMRIAASVLLIYTALVPILTFINEGQSGKLDAIFDIDTEENLILGEEYVKVAEEAFRDGISKLIFTKYGINEKNCDVYTFGFDFETMRAERIRVVLRGSDAFADLRGIESYINGLSLGECEVTVSFE